MYRVVIIDDEMIIRVGFKSFIDWNAEGFEMVGEASNGLEGLELCRRVRPHVVFTDIVMAKLDGIGFIERLLKEQPEAKVIVLSCIEEFGTLQKALRLGVRDYFLKLSFSPAQLVPMLRTLRQELDGEVRGGEAAAKEADRSGLSTYLQLQQAYRSYIQKRASPATLPPQSRLSQAAMEGEGSALFLIQRDGALAEENAPECLTPAISILNEMFAREYPCDIVELAPGSTLMVLEGCLPMTRGDVTGVMSEMQNNLMRMMQLSVSIGASLSMGNLRGFYPAYEALLELEDKRFYEGERTLFIRENQAPLFVKAEKELNWAALADRVADALAAYDFQKARRELEEMLQKTARMRTLQRSSVLDGVMLSLMQYDRACRRGILGGFGPDMELGRIAAQSWTLERLISQCLEFVTAVEQSVESRRREGGVRIEIEKAKAYVRGHLGDSINARAVAGMLGFNYSYFSVLFKKETGMNFSDYLSKERMHAAMRMLVETRLSVADIANRLGYSDVSHFRKLFRNEFGKGTGEVRAQQGPAE